MTEGQRIKQLLEQLWQFGGCRDPLKPVRYVLLESKNYIGRRVLSWIRPLDQDYPYGSHGPLFDWIKGVRR